MRYCCALLCATVVLLLVLGDNNNTPVTSHSVHYNVACIYAWWMRTWHTQKCIPRYECIYVHAYTYVCTNTRPETSDRFASYEASCRSNAINGKVISEGKLESFWRFLPHKKIAVARRQVSDVANACTASCTLDPRNFPFNESSVWRFDTAPALNRCWHIAQTINFKIKLLAESHRMACMSCSTIALMAVMMACVGATGEPMDFASDDCVWSRL